MRLGVVAHEAGQLGVTLVGAHPPTQLVGPRQLRLHRSVRAGRDRREASVGAGVHSPVVADLVEGREPWEWDDAGDRPVLLVLGEDGLHPGSGNQVQARPAQIVVGIHREGRGHVEGVEEHVARAVSHQPARAHGEGDLVVDTPHTVAVKPHSPLEGVPEGPVSVGVVALVLVPADLVLHPEAVEATVVGADEQVLVVVDAVLLPPQDVEIDRGLPGGLALEQVVGVEARREAIELPPLSGQEVVVGDGAHLEPVAEPLGNRHLHLGAVPAHPASGRWLRSADRDELGSHRGSSPGRSRRSVRRRSPASAPPRGPSAGWGRWTGVPSTSPRRAESRWMQVRRRRAP